MTESHDPQPQPPRSRSEFWTEVVCPTASSLESFFWKLAWFAVIVCLLFYSQLFV